MSGRVEFVSFDSQVLADNPLQDPAERAFPVYLPPGYDADASRRYPVVYVLQGYGGSGLSVENYSPWGERLSDRLDRLIERGLCRPLIAVAPDCFTRYGGSQYVNSAATGRYQDYLVDEVVDFVDARYRTLAGPRGRAVVGRSSGGYGALRALMDRPEVFGAAACHAGDMGFEYCYLPDFPAVVAAVGHPPDIEGFMARFLSKAKKPSSEFSAMSILAMAACYSPNPSARLGFDLPFDPYSGRIDEVVWGRWLEHDPVRRVERHAEALRGAALLFVDCGRRDNFNLHLGARQLHLKLLELEVPHEYEEFDDDHFGLTYRYDVSIPKLVAALE
jgi:enterochelin esterase family protein